MVDIQDLQYKMHKKQPYNFSIKIKDILEESKPTFQKYYKHVAFLKALKENCQKGFQEKNLDLVLQIGISQNLSSQAKIQMKSLLFLFPREKVISQLKSLSIQAQNPIFNYLDTEIKQQFIDLAQNFLSSTLLQDRSTASFPLWISDIVDVSFYRFHIHNQIIKLLNRNSLNMHILLVLLQNLKIDFSSFLDEYFEQFKELFLDEKHADNAVDCYLKMLNLSKTINASQAYNITNLIDQTFNEKQQVKLLRILPGLNTQEATDFFLTKCSGLQSDDSLPIVSLVVPLIKHTPSNLNLSSTNPRYQTIVAKVLNHLKNSQFNKELQKNILSNFIKNPTKIVSHSGAYLSALGLQTEPTLLPEYLSKDLFVNKFGFFQKASGQELGYLLQGYTAMYSDKLTPQQDIFISGVIYSILKNPNMKIGIIQKNLASQSIRLVVRVLFIDSFYSEIEKQKLQFLFQWIIKNIEHIKEDFLLQTLYALYALPITQNIRNKFVQKSDKNLIYNSIKQNSQEYLFWAMNENANPKFAKCFGDFQCDFMLEHFLPVFSIANYQLDSELIQQMTHTFLSYNSFCETLRNMQNILLENQFVEKSLPFIQIEIKKEVIQQQKPKTKGISQPAEKQQTKKDKIEYFDEESLLKYQKKMAMDTGCEYLKNIARVISQWVTSSQNQEIFFKQIYPNMIKLSELSETHNSLYDILNSIFSQNASTKDHNYQLCELILKIVNEETQNDENVENLMRFLKKLRQKDQPKHLLHFFKLMAQYFLKNKHFESKIKRISVECIYNLLQISASPKDISACYIIFVENVNNLSKYEFSEPLFFFLVKSVDQDLIKLIFKDLLNLNEVAQNLMLKSLLLDTVKDLPSDFEMFMTLKIIISQQSQLGIQVFDKINFKLKPIKEESIQEFDLYRFLTRNVKENTDTFCSIVQKEINDIQWNGILIKKSLEALKRLVEYELPEELMLFVPILLSKIKVDKSYYQLIFQTIIEQCCFPNLPNVFDSALKYCLQLIKENGNHCSSIFLAVLDPYLEKNMTVQQQIFILGTFYIIVNMGVLAPFIQNKEKVNTLGNKILNLLKLPDENLQKSISKCIPDLFIFFEDPSALISLHIKTLLIEKNIEIQRGHAYLISGLVKGLGVATIETEKIFELFEYNEKKELTHKTGLLQLLNALIENLQKVFEPYFLHFFDFLLPFFSENQEQVRNLAIQVCKKGMIFMSNYGVSQLLPKLLKSLEERPQWRSKIATLWALGNMAYCSPKTLSSCLPQIVPILSNAISDTHPKIQTAAMEALTLIGATIRNPEITVIVDILIKALSNPFDHNKKGLNILLKTEFAHFIDIPALSIIIPILEYALTSKDEESKSQAGRIVATITNLIKDPRDVLPYLPQLIESLLSAVSDHIVEVRTIAAKAFGSLGKKLGITQGQPLKKALFGLLDVEATPSVQRGGAAQALCEVLCSMGVSVFESYLPLILQQAQSDVRAIKEGYIGMFLFFPQIMDDQFEKYISLALESILVTISHENENLRNLALRVIRIFIQKYGSSQVELLLNPVLEGAFSQDYLRRTSCCILIDDILKSVKMEKSDYYNKTIVSLYILRSDYVDSIKIQATNSWKVQFLCQANIENTPKTIKKLLKVLIYSLCELNSTMSENIQSITLSCMKEFVEKYQEQCLFETINHIVSYAKVFFIIQEFPNKSWAAFYLLEAVINDAEKYLIKKIMDDLISLIRQNMADRSDILRKYVFQVFKALLHKSHDTSIIDLLVNPLIENPEPDNIDLNLLIFSELLNSDSDLMVDSITPKLFSDPLTPFKVEIMMNNAKILAPKLYPNGIAIIFPQLFQSNQKNEQLIYCINQLSINLPENDLQQFLLEIMDYLKEDLTPFVFDILIYFMKNTCHEFQTYFVDIFEFLVKQTTQQDEQVARYINEILQIVLNIEQDASHYLYILNKGFSEIQGLIWSMSIQDGLLPYMGVLKWSLVQGREEDFENGLTLLSCIINQVDEHHLKDHMSTIFGILIRVLNYRRESQTKKKIIDMLDFFQDQEIITQYIQQIICTYINLLGTNIEPILKDLVKSLLQMMGLMTNQCNIMNYLLNKLSKVFNDNFLYAIYELVKVKSIWFCGNHQQIIDVLKMLMKIELIAKSKILIGKIFGLLLKQNPTVSDFMLEQLILIQGSEVDIQNGLYYYVLTCASMIHKSQDMHTLTNKNFQLMECVAQIKNQQRLDRVAQLFKKFIERPEMRFLGIQKEQVLMICRQQDNE